MKAGKRKREDGYLLSVFTVTQTRRLRRSVRAFAQRGLKAKGSRCPVQCVQPASVNI